MKVHVLIWVAWLFLLVLAVGVSATRQSPRETPSGAVFLKTVHIDSLAGTIDWTVSVEEDGKETRDASFSLNIDTGLVSSKEGNLQIGVQEAMVIFQEMGHMAKVLNWLTVEVLLKDYKEIPDDDSGSVC